MFKCAEPINEYSEFIKEHIKFIEDIIMEELMGLGFSPNKNKPLHDELDIFLKENNLSLTFEYKKDMSIYKCVDNINNIVLFKYLDNIITDFTKGQATRYFTKII